MYTPRSRGHGIAIAITVTTVCCQEKWSGKYLTYRTGGYGPDTVDLRRSMHLLSHDIYSDVPFPTVFTASIMHMQRFDTLHSYELDRTIQYCNTRPPYKGKLLPLTHTHTHTCFLTIRGYPLWHGESPKR